MINSFSGALNFVVEMAFNLKTMNKIYYHGEKNLFASFSAAAPKSNKSNLSILFSGA